jgi:YVTN family beta-propeller protein
VVLRYDRLGVEIPAGDPDPAGAMAVQELMGGRFGEMSTLMNYTFQSFGFCGRKELRPFYDLIANIAAEEYGHIEAVGATITTMLKAIDTDTRRVSSTVSVGPTGTDPFSVRATGDALYVANQGASTLSVLDPSTFRATAPIATGNSPFGIAVVQPWPSNG